jgi:uncharacterized protein YhbP (UPF0306 family)
VTDESRDDLKLLFDALDASEVLVLATRAQSGELRATPLFHARVDGFASPRLVFASKPSSEHGLHLGEGPTRVAAATYAPHESIASIRGTQLRGEVWPIEARGQEEAAGLRDGYLARYPMAAALLAKALISPPARRERLYLLAVDWAKLTDNQHLGLGVHREWEFPSAEGGGARA